MLVSKSPATYVVKLDESELLDLELAMRQLHDRAIKMMLESPITNRTQEKLDHWREMADALAEAKMRQ